ncbi:efflux RND transporter periplasmic adaptor subunit [Thauera sp. CAU 1555]|uniref:Efflux RND transporter periplasmic adaptor subunit n=1 Tax=Thauera sedimentorum TaxID=2767595 RepID=A0ABR9BDE7_9RHOO|nr:efflux RND transporter periplasmic adaptor subunit [Thauera sedimentorum]MBC9073456.1 efflux RND transporter periplasmic adaptor subunit [Thauera sedimentorum]MBD8504375.1 efflux RND transporter periplasmic adaptor subunit [Thauera sedimentorum]
MNDIFDSVRRLLCGAVLLAAGVASPALAEVPTLRVEAAQSALSMPFEASIEAVHQSVVAARVPGRILAYEVDAGDRVARGEVLVRIDAEEAAAGLAQAEAGVAQAEAALINARANFTRSQALFERRFISQAALDQARAGLDAAEAAMRAAQAGRSQAGVARDYGEIRAPFDGLVAARHAEPGEMAQPGMPLLTVYQPGAMRALVDLPQRQFAGLEGRPLQARVEVVDDGRFIDAAAVTVLPAADARTHTLRMRVDLPPAVEGVLPGMFVRVHLLGGEAARLMVPGEAVLRRGELTALYVADGDGRFVLRQVRVGAPGADGRVEVLAGLRAGETIALDPVAAGIAAAAGRSR